MSFRFDHGLQQFFDNGYADKLKSRQIPCSVGVVGSTVGNPTHPYEPLTYTWTEIRKKFREYGIEAWSHSWDHMDPTTVGASVWYQVVGVKQLMEENGIHVVGFHAAGVPNCGCPHFSNNFNNVQGDRQGWDHEYGGLIYSNHGLFHVLGNQGGQIRYLPTVGDFDLGHATLDTMTLAQAQANVNYLIDHSAAAVGEYSGSVLGINFMTHCRQVQGGPGQYPEVVMTPANWMAFVDWCADLRDAGKIEILTNSALAFSDGGTSRRANLLMDPTFAANVVPASSSTYPWAKAGGSGTFTIEGGAGPNGENALVLPAAGGYTYAYQGNAQMQTLDMAGSVLEAGCYVKAITSATECRITVINPNITDVNHVDYLNVEYYVSIPADGQWKKIRFPVCLPKSIDNVQFRVSRRVGTGDLKVTRCWLWPT